MGLAQESLPLLHPAPPLAVLQPRRGPTYPERKVPVLLQELVDLSVHLALFGFQVLTLLQGLVQAHKQTEGGRRGHTVRTQTNGERGRASPAINNSHSMHLLCRGGREDADHGKQVSGRGFVLLLLRGHRSSTFVDYFPLSSLYLLGLC